MVGRVRSRCNVRLKTKKGTAHLYVCSCNSKGDIIIWETSHLQR